MSDIKPKKVLMALQYDLNKPVALCLVYVGDIELNKELLQRSGGPLVKPLWAWEEVNGSS